VHLPQLQINQTKREFFKMAKVNHEVVNMLAIEIQGTKDAELRDLYVTQLFEELDQWIKFRAMKGYEKVRMYKGDYNEVLGKVHDTIWRVLTDEKFSARYDSSKGGDFVGYVYNALKNPINDYIEYLTAERRNVFVEGKSLNEQVNDEADNTLGDLIEDKQTNIANEISDSMYVTNLLDDFSAITKDGQAKAKAIYLTMYPEMYDNQDVAEALGYSSYDASARKKLQRVRKEFQNFMSQRGE
jgi:phosphoribosyl-ATP pyrophosphohydrolase